MTMSSQSQQASEGALAVQSGRDTIVKQGISTSQMTEILGALAAQFPAQQAAAQQLVTERLADFEKYFLEKFSNSTIGNSGAFADPDFQFIVRASQHAYARSGDEGVRDTLVDLIARRSLATERTRLSLTLNEAIEKAARLTKNEFAELSLCYLIRYTQNGGVNNLDSFAKYFSDYISPLLPDISEADASYQYIEAQVCGTVSVLKAGVVSQLRTNYAGVFSKGFDRITLESHLPDGKKNVLDEMLMQCLNDAERLQFNVLNKDTFMTKSKKFGLEQGQLDNVWNMFFSTVWDDEEFLFKVEPAVPQIRMLKRMWDETNMCKLTLNTAGIAIGHTNLVRLSKLDADLSIWIK